MGFRNAVTYVYPGLMANKDMQRIIQTKDVDLVILDGIWNDFTYAMIDHLGVPFVIYSPGPGATWTLESMSVDQEFASVPNMGLEVHTPMSFPGRVLNLVSTKVFMFIRKFSILWHVDAMAEKDFPNARPKQEIERDATLCLANIDRATSIPRNLPPTFIPAGAMHCRPAQSLPKVSKQLFCK